MSQSLRTVCRYLGSTGVVIEREPVSPYVRDIHLSGELVGAQMSQEDGVALLHPVLNMLHPSEAGPRLQTHGPTKLSHQLVLATEQLRSLQAILT